MTRSSAASLDALWARHHAEWRSCAQVASQWQDAAETDPALLHHVVRGDWWETLARTGLTLLVSREYEHLLMAMRVDDRGPRVTFMRMPHPSGLTVDRARGIVCVASTRNPNQIFDLGPVASLLPRGDQRAASVEDRPLVPLRSRFLPGCTYMHDLAVIDGRLHANAVGQNAVIRVDDDGRYERVWWPRCVETAAGPAFEQNYIQLNSIAAGADLAGSYFSASAERLSARRPGHRDFPVDRRGVVFSGATREPIVRGLTRPHSARLHRGRLWVANSGYGELGVVDGGRFAAVARLPGWTRGLCFADRVAFAATSRVIPRFRQYAPGLDVDASVCGVHAVDVETGRLLGSLIWPSGNQIFAVATIESRVAGGFPFAVGRPRASQREKALFYAFGGTLVDRPAAGPDLVAEHNTVDGKETV